MMTKTIITSTGFFNTGSSAITHLLSEIDGVANHSDVYEIRLLYDPDCISDLEYHLVENPHRQNSGYALLRFRDYIEFNTNSFYNHHYEKLCKGNFKSISYEYINNLTEFQYYGISHLDELRKGKLFWFLNRCYKKFVKLFLTKNTLPIVKETMMSPSQLYAPTFKEDVFLNSTKGYIGKLLGYLNEENDVNILIDQLLPPTNIARYERYFPDEYKLKVFIVDRDPRDLYVICKKLENGKAVPCDDANMFCDWYLWTRRQSMAIPDPQSVMRIQFEDLIYEYEKTRDDIIYFCGLEKNECSRKRTVFKPELSINNTQTWKRFPDTAEDIKIIENRLSTFCYDYDSKQLKPDFVNGKMFEC